MDGALDQFPLEFIVGWFFFDSSSAWISKKKYSRLLSVKKSPGLESSSDETVPQLKIKQTRKFITLPHAVTILRLQKKMKQKKLTHPFNVILTYIQTLFEKESLSSMDDLTILKKHKICLTSNHRN
jgi:hypothetical protein